MIVDFEGRILAQADPGPGEKTVVTTIDIGALRHERQRRTGHLALAHLRSEAYPMYRRSFFPGGGLTEAGNQTFEMNQKRIAEARSAADSGLASGE